MSLPSVTLPSELDEATQLAFIQNARSAQRIDCSTNSRIEGSWFTECHLPSIHHLHYTGCQELNQCERFFTALPNVIGMSYFPVAPLTATDFEYLEAINRSGLWEQLQYLYVHQLPICNPFPPGHWPKLWQGRNLQFVEMNLSFQNAHDASIVLQAHFPKLERLSLSSCLGDSLLDWLLASHLPSLRYLDLRFNLISSDALSQFAKTITHRSPLLSEISIDYGTGEKIESYDWNGAVVDYYYGVLSNEDITAKYLHGTKLKAVPSQTLYF